MGPPVQNCNMDCTKCGTVLQPSNQLFCEKHRRQCYGETCCPSKHFIEYMCHSCRTKYKHDCSQLPEEELNKKYAALNHHLQLFKEFKETCKANKKGSGKTEENNLMQGYHWKVPRWFLVYILQLQHHQHQHSMQLHLHHRLGQGNGRRRVQRARGNRLRKQRHRRL